MPSVRQSFVDIAAVFPKDALKILLVLFLSFLVGLEREGRKGEAAPMVPFGGVRTFPLIGLTGYALSLVSGGSLLPFAAGLLVVGGLMALSYRHKLDAAEDVGNPAGATTEVSALFTFLVGAIVQQGYYWVAAALVVVALLLLELKAALEQLSRRIPREEVLSFTQFLVLTVVILPIVPDESFGPFKLNPYKTWLVVVAVATISYTSYVLQRVLRGRGGVILTAVLGGAYSSTVTTISLSRKAATSASPHLFSGAILVASSLMYLRLAVLVSMFNRGLMHELALPFCGLGVVSGIVGFVWSRRGDRTANEMPRDDAKNPLELSAAFMFAALFIAMLVITHLVVTYVGRGGVYALAAIMGVTDVDPFILGMTQSTGATTPLAVGAAAIVIAAASNNVVKGIYARSFSDRQTGTYSLILLAGLAVLGLVPLVWIL